VSGEALVTEEVYTPEFMRGVVLGIAERVEGDTDHWFTSVDLFFHVRITDSTRQGDVVFVQQSIAGQFIGLEREVAVGDRIVLVYDSFGSRFFFVSHVRINHIVILGGVFLVLVIILGRAKGFNGILSLGLSCLAIIAVFIPGILSGFNIYLMAFVVCLYAIVSTFFLVIGINKKALTAILGCLSGVILAGVLMGIMDFILGLSGVVDHDSLAILNLPLINSLDLRGLIFAGIIFGAVGAIMDVSMSIASALWEIKESGGASDFKNLLKSGLTIGQDTLGTMLNTLILAYIGSSLTMILLITASTPSFTELLNMEMIIVEFLRAIIGSFGMLLTIPLTALICAKVFSQKDEDGAREDLEEDSYFEEIRLRQEARRSRRE